MPSSDRTVTLSVATVKRTRQASSFYAFHYLPLRRAAEVYECSLRFQHDSGFRNSSQHWISSWHDIYTWMNFTSVFQRRYTVGKTYTKIGAHNLREEKIAKLSSYMFYREQRLSDTVPVCDVAASEGRGHQYWPRSKLPNTGV